jgi:BASS family bile acid:Na+ symporter
LEKPNVGREKGDPMKEIIITTLQIIAPLAVAFIVFAQGLKISPSQVMIYFKERPWLMLRSLAAVLVVVPAAALGIILLLQPSREVVVGLAILVACPPAPLMLKATPNLGKGSAAYMASLHLSLAVLAFITVPIVLDLISMPLGFHADVDLLKMAWILGRTILIPVALGIAVRSFFPKFADMIGPRLDKVGAIGLLVVVVFALARFFPALLRMDLWSYVVIVVVSAVALAMGHLLGPRDPHERTTLAVESGVRHPVLAITIAASNFSPEKALPVLVPCVLVFIVVAMVYLVWRKRGLAARVEKKEGETR